VAWPGAPLDVLDVGVGTGKLARAFRARGNRVVGVDVDDRMAEVARAHGIPVSIGAFEDWDAEGARFDLIVAGQAWHWLRPADAARHAATLLRRPHGVLAALWNLYDPDPSIGPELHEVYAQVAPELTGSVLLGSAVSGVGASEQQLRDSGAFDWVRRHSVAWHSRFTAKQWLDLAATHSDHRALDPDRAARLAEATTRLIAAHGGVLLLQQSTDVLLAGFGPPREPGPARP
jgi:protein-tyrosine-phosphatase